MGQKRWGRGVNPSRILVLPEKDDPFSLTLWGFTRLISVPVNDVRNDDLLRRQTFLGVWPVPLTDLKCTGIMEFLRRV